MVFVFMKFSSFLQVIRKPAKSHLKKPFTIRREILIERENVRMSERD